MTSVKHLLMWTDAKTYQGLSRPSRACVSFRVKAFQSREDSCNIGFWIMFNHLCFFRFLSPPIEWLRMDEDVPVVTRAVSSILGCQHPRSSFQMATNVEAQITHQQQTNHNGAVKQAMPIETSHKSFLPTESGQTHFWWIASFQGYKAENCEFEKKEKCTRWVTLPATSLISIIWKNASGHCTYLYVYCVVEEHQMTTKRAVSFWYRRICDIMR